MATLTREAYLADIAPRFAATNTLVGAVKTDVAALKADLDGRSDGNKADIAALSARVDALSAKADVILAAVKAIPTTGTGGGGGTIPPDTNVYPLTTAGSWAGKTDPIILGAGPDQLQFHYDLGLNSAVSEMAILMDGKPIAAPLLFGGFPDPTPLTITIHGSWGPMPHTVTMANTGNGMRNISILSATYNFVPLVNNGPPTFRGDTPHVNALTVWDNADLNLDWTAPIVVPPPPPPPPVTEPSIIAATINGAAATDTLAKLVAATPAGGTLALPAGTFAGTALVDKAMTISGAGVGQTIIDGTGIRPTFDKACFLISAPSGVTIQGMHIRRFSIVPSLGANAAGVRNEGNVSASLIDLEISECQDGILGSAEATWALERVNFHDNGTGDVGGGNTHEQYFGAGAVTETDCAAVCGAGSTHAFKSRAGATTATNGRYTSGTTGFAGATMDVPNAGVVVMNGCFFMLPATAPNRTFFQYGADTPSAAMSVTLKNCIFTDGTGSGGVIKSFQPGVPLDVTGSTYTGAVAPVLQGWGTVTGTITKAGVVDPPPPAPLPVLLPALRFFGDADNNGTLAGQARVAITDGIVQMPFFAMLYFRQIEHPSYGMLFSFGNQANAFNGIFALATHGSGGMMCFEKWGGPMSVIKQGPVAPVGKWMHATLNFKALDDVDVIVDGAPFIDPVAAGWPPQPALTWPRPNSDGTGLIITMGSYLEMVPGGPSVGRDLLNGTLRNVVCGLGTATPAEIARHAGGETGLSIFGAARLVGEWPMDAIPVVDISGHGRHLTLIDGGSAPRHTGPVLVTT